MTSLLRRKRQITVRSTPPAKVPKTPANQSDVAGGNPPFSISPSTAFAAALLVGLLVAAWSGPTVAEDSSTRRSRTSYTVTAQGNKLKWLPYRPSKPRADGRAAATERVARATSVPVLRTAQRSRTNPFDDPFGDSQSQPPTVQPGATTNDEAMDGPPPELELRSLPEEPPLEGPGEMPAPAADAALDSAIGAADQQGGLEDDYKCPSPMDKNYYRAIGKLTTDTTPRDKEDKPLSKDELPLDCALTKEGFKARVWAPTTFTWKASGLCHKPLYFEDVHLERYGHSWGPYLQPIISGGHFFLTVPVLPYKMGLYPPNECIYTLGYYRPGSCAPYMLDPLPLSVRAGLAEAGAWVGGVYLIP